MPRCKHQWQFVEFQGNPEWPSWNNTVKERCECGNDRTRRATDEDARAEMQRTMCPTCNTLYSIHDGDIPLSCIKLLIARVSYLEDRMKAVEQPNDDW